MVKTSHYQTDRAGVDVAERMASNLSVRRTNVRARRTADAMKCFRELGHGRHRSPAVVEQHNVHVVTRSRTGDERGVAGNPLCGSRAREKPELRDRIVEGRNELFDTREDDVHRRNGGAETTIAFVG